MTTPTDCRSLLESWSPRFATWRRRRGTLTLRKARERSAAGGPGSHAYRVPDRLGLDERLEAGERRLGEPVDPRCGCAQDALEVVCGRDLERCRELGIVDAS